MIDEAIFEKHLTCLIADDPWPHRQWNDSLVVFMKAAGAGIDISPATGAIENLFLKCHHSDILALAADTLVEHYLAVSDFDALSRLARKEKTHDEIAEALCRHCMRGKVPSRAIYLLVESMGLSWLSQYRIYDSLAYYIGKDESRMAEVLTLMNERAWLREKIPAFLKGALFILKKLDHAVLACTVPFLLVLLPHEKVTMDSMEVIRLLAELDVDITSALPAVEELLDHRSDAVRRLAAYSLVVYRGDKPLTDFSMFDHLVRDTRASVRAGALDALGFSMGQGKMHARECSSRVARMLVDDDAAIRKSAFLVLEKALRAGTDCDPGMETMTYLFIHRRHGDHYLFRYLIWRVERNLQTAQALLDVLQSPARGLSEEMKLLAGHCREICAGTHIPACTICAFIPREHTCSFELDVPGEVMKLQPEKPVSWSGIRRCPQCGNYYRTSYSVEYESPTEGMSVDIDIEITRLSPPEALELLSDKDLEALRESYDGLIEKALRLKAHPERYLREDGACTLTLHYLRRKGWKELNSLLHQGDEVIRLTSLKILSRGEMPVIAEIAGSIELLLKTGSMEIKKNAAMLLARYYFHVRDIRALKRISEMDDTVVRTAVIQMIRADGTGDTEIFLRLMREPLASTDENLRYQAGLALTESIAMHMDVSRSIERLIELVSHEKKRIREQALSLLKQVVDRVGLDILMPALVTLLADDGTGPHAFHALKSLARKRDISEAFPLLIGIATDRSSGRRLDAGYVLHEALKGSIKNRKDRVMLVEFFSGLLFDEQHAMRQCGRYFQDAYRQRQGHIRCPARLE